MSTTPRLITMRGIGPQRLRHMVTPRESGSRVPPVDIGRGVIMVRPVGQTAIAGRDYQWKYELRRVRFNPYTEANIDIAGVADIYGYNSFERGNLSTIVAPGIETAALIALGWTIGPVGVSRLGTRVDMSFPAWPIPDGEGGVVLEFCQPNPIDGPCALPEEPE